VIGPTGLPQYRYPDWRAGLVSRWRDAYGDAADTSPETPDGLVIDTITLETTQLGEAVQSAYANSFVRTAEGVSLDLHLDVFGRQRLAARATTVTAVWYGDPSTVVWGGVGTGPAATVIASGVSNGDRYVVQEAGNIPAADDASVVVYEITRVVDGDDYGIEFDDGTGAVEQIIQASGTDPQTLAEALAVDVASTWPAYTVTTHPHPNHDRWVMVVRGSWLTAAIAPSATNPSNAVVYGGVALRMDADTTGPRQVLAGTLIQIATPAAGLEGVVNPADGRPGRDRESDEAFRSRHFDQINVGGRGTPARIRAALLDQDPADRDPLDLEDVAVFNNPDSVTATISGRTLPPNSFEVVLLGDATDEQIAPVLFAQAPAGIRSVGTTTETVDDETSGGPQDVSWTRATELYLHLAITVTRGEGFPTTGDPAGAIEAAVAADLPVVLRLGRDCYRERVRGLASCSLPGIVSVVVTADATAAPGDPPTLVGLDIEVASDEILRVDSSRITVTLV
jgi:hypothetical protein